MNSFITPPCISVYVIRNTLEGPRYLLLRRCEKYLFGTWQMVFGNIDQPETASQAAFREIQEETGLTPSALYSADRVEMFFLQNENKILFVPIFVAFVEDAHVRLSQEHDAYEWLEFEEARKRLVWAEQKRSIAHIQEYFVQNTPNDLMLIKGML